MFGMLSPRLRSRRTRLEACKNVRTRFRALRRDSNRMNFTVPTMTSIAIAPWSLRAIACDNVISSLLRVRLDPMYASTQPKRHRTNSLLFFLIVLLLLFLLLLFLATAVVDDSDDTDTKNSNNTNHNKNNNNNNNTKNNNNNKATTTKTMTTTTTPPITTTTA